MKAIFIGCVDFSNAMLVSLLNYDAVNVVGIATRQASTINADFYSLAPVAESHGIPCFLAQGNDQNTMEKWIRKLSPDVIFCLGWSYLLNEAILEIPRLGVVGYHPAPLPRGRGRHPIIWSLALGLTKTASTFFIMDKGADSGDIIEQQTGRTPCGCVD